MTKNEIINKLLKIKALADSGDSGERSAAEKMLARMMEKYGVGEDDLISEQESVHYFRVHGCKGKDLFGQVAVIYCGVQKYRYIGKDAWDKGAKTIRKSTSGLRPRNANMVAICTPAKFLELQYAYEMFQQSLDKHLEGMFYAFLDTNNLLAPYNPSNPKSNMEDDEIEIAYRMGLAVKKADVRKALPQNMLPE